ncbi:hypothetical protein [Halosegnis longus]|uniref:hypothetical protein n=1 Tax=Halosegnis longus TaxID=2216012 RepID=UPI0015629712|nr:hypothetical protein [Halosegnis longus]
MYTDLRHVYDVVMDMFERQQSKDLDDLDVTVNVTKPNQIVVDGLTPRELDERNIRDDVGDQICRLTIEPGGGTRRMDLKFHQSVVDEPFMLDPHDPTDPAVLPSVSSQFSDPRDISKSISAVLKPFEDEFELELYFNSVSAASIGTGYNTDFEFEFEVVFPAGPVR